MKNSNQSVPFADYSGTGPAIRKLLLLSLDLSLIMVVYGVLDYSIIEGTRLNEAAYQTPYITAKLIAHGWSSPRIAALVVALVVLGGWYFRGIFRDWEVMEFGPKLRPFVALVAAILAWRFSTYDYNFYFDQAHLFDRLLLIALVPLIWWRPLFLFPFLFLLCAVIWQFAYPLGFYSWAQQYMPIRLLTLAGATLLLTVTTGRRLGNQCVFLSCCLVMAHYWVPGIEKLSIDWVSQGHIYNLLPSTYANGWLSFLAPESISGIAGVLAQFDPAIVFFTLLFQLGSIVALWRRQLLIALLCIYPFFHLAIFTISGIFFWQWILVEAALVLLVTRVWSTAPSVFVWQYFVWSVVLIAGSAIWFKPVALAWYDSNLAYTTKFYATGESGARYTLSPDFFAPYQYPFTLGNFAYMVDRPHLGTVWGSSRNAAVVEGLRSATDLKQVRELELRLGKNLFNVNRVVVFDKFIRRFTESLNQRGSRGVLPPLLLAPPQLWTFPRGNAYQGQEKIRNLQAYLVTSLFSDRRYVEIDEEFLGVVGIPLSDDL